MMCGDCRSDIRSLNIKAVGFTVMPRVSDDHVKGHFVESFGIRLASGAFDYYSASIFCVLWQ